MKINRRNIKAITEKTDEILKLEKAERIINHNYDTKIYAVVHSQHNENAAFPADVQIELPAHIRDEIKLYIETRIDSLYNEVNHIID